MSVLKRLSAKLAPPKALIILACALSSLCTAAYVTNVYILRPVWLSLFVFAGIFAVQGIMLYTAARIFKSAPSFQAVLLSVAAAVLMTVACRDIFFPTRQETYISLTAETAGEICLCDVVVDGENIPVAEVRVVENSGWLYRKLWDNFVIWPEEDGVENRLTLCFVAAEVHLGFPYTPYAGSVTIESSAGRGGGTWDLCRPEQKAGEEVQYADFSFDCHQVYSPLALLLYSAGILPLISFVFLLLFYKVCSSWRKNGMRVNYLLSWIMIIGILFLSWIQLELSSTFDNWRDVFTIDAKYIAVNIVTICTVFLLIHSIISSLWKSCAIFSITMTLLSAANYYVIEFHGTPLTFMELKNFETALNFIGDYQFELRDIAGIIFIFCVEIGLCWIIKKTGAAAWKKRSPWRKLGKALCLYAIVYGIVFFTYLSSNPIMDKEVGSAWAGSYHEAGYAACTVKLAVDSANFLQKPDGYEEGIGNIELVNAAQNAGESDWPDIILILNESFYDLSLIADIKTDVPYLENTAALENTIRGYAAVPYIGGSTNCSEYELLTSNSLRLMPGVTPFNVINMKGANTAASYLKQLGYYTIAGHPEKGSNYNRINAYADMGLDEYHFNDDFTDRKSYGDSWLLTDESAYENILRWMNEHTDTPQLMYLLTMQNHGPWGKNGREYDTVHVSGDYGELNEVMDEYLTGIRLSDAAFKHLTDQLKGYHKKVIVCMVGDHSPSFAGEIVAEEHRSASSLLLRSTPFIIWANFDIEDKDMGTISMNYLIPTLFEAAEVPLSQYYQYMLNLMKDIPILMTDVYYDKNMNEYRYDADSKYSKAVNDYFYMNVSY